MRPTIFILTLLILSGCQFSRNKNDREIMSDIRDSIPKQLQEFNNETESWENKTAILYKRADKNLKDGINYGDSLIASDKSLDGWKIAELHMTIGELYYDNDSIDQALNRFYASSSMTFDSPRDKANKAGCYIKKGDFETAMELLEQAAETNSDFKWYIGNLYEIQNQKMKAIEQYQFLYQKDTSIYSYCKRRISDLNQPNPKLFTSLYFKDRRKRSLLLFKDAD